MARQAVADGRTGIRVAAENASILKHPQIRDRWFDYELQVDALVAQEPIVGLCSFDRRVCDDETLRLLDAVHLVQQDPSGSAPHSPFHLHSVEGDVLVLTGDVDGLGARAFQRLLSASTRGRERLRLDLRGLSYLAPAGMRAIEELAHQRPMTYAPLELQGITPFQARVWSLMSRPVGGP